MFLSSNFNYFDEITGYLLSCRENRVSLIDVDIQNVFGTM